MPIVKLAPPPRQQFEDANGNPYVGAKLFTYVAGSTTKQATYTDNTGTTPNSNPIELDAAGRTPFGLWLAAGLFYKFVLAPATDTDPPTSPVFTEDVITGVNDTTTPAALATSAQWVASGLTPTFVNATQFTLVGDQRSAFHVGRRLRLTVTAGTVYGEISVSAFTTLTTVTVVLDSGALDAGLSAVDVGIVTAINSSIPKALTLGAQPVDATLTALAGLATGADRMPYSTGTDVFAQATLTAFARTVLDDTTAAAARSTLAVRVLQVVHFDTGALATGTTIIPLDDTIPQQTEGDEYMSLAITPISATSTLLVNVVIHGSLSANLWFIAALFRDAAAASIGASVTHVAAATGGSVLVFSANVAAGSTALTTFKVRAGPDGVATLTLNGQSGVRFFGGVMASSIRITELAA